MSKNRKHQRRKKGRERRREARKRERPETEVQAWKTAFFARGGKRKLLGFSTRGGGWVSVNGGQTPGPETLTIAQHIAREKALKSEREGLKS